MCLIGAYTKGRSDASIMHPYVKNYMYVYVNYKIKIQPIKIVNEYDQEKPQSQTADNPVAPRGRAAQPLRDTR